mgnify:CR=1 FL=1
MNVSFEASKQDEKLLNEISTRIWKHCEKYEIECDILSINMDLTACHVNGCLLDLKRLLDSDESNFAHDVFGISNHIDRETGKLTKGFLPRFAI